MTNSEYSFKQKEKRATQYANRVKDRLCVWCKTPLEEDNNGVLCSDCAKKNNQRSRESREWFISNGICPVCKKEKIYPPEKSCLNCREKANMLSKDAKRIEHQKEITKKRIQARREAGLCSCGRKPEDGYKMCSVCRWKQRMRKRKGEWSKTEERRWNGICKCGSSDMQEGSLLCKRCYAVSCKNLEKGREKLRQQKIQEQIDRGILLVDPPITFKKKKMKQPVVYMKGKYT